MRSGIDTVARHGARGWLALLAIALVLAGCGTARKGVGVHEGIRTSPVPIPDPRHPRVTDLPDLPPAGSGRGGYYLDDGPGENPPPNLVQTPDAEVKAEPYLVWPNKPYSRFGKQYVPMVNDEPFTQRGVGSWYGRKFHGRRTSSGEPYDMYKMTAAHPTLPIPSYARVTSLETGKQVVVRINDRGPFHAGRVIDLSFTAALKLGLLGKGSHEVQVERLFPALPQAEESLGAARRNAPAIAAPEAVQALPVSLPTADTVVALPGAPAAAPVAPATAVPLPGSFYVQLGAFSRAELAEAFRRQLSGHAALLGQLEVAEGGALHRVYSGPFATRAQAHQVIAALPSTLQVRPIVVRR